MQYMLLIYDDELEFDAMREDEKQRVYGEYMALVGDLGDAYVTGAPLAPTSAASWASLPRRSSRPGTGASSFP